MNYAGIMARREEILRKSSTFDYSSFRRGKLAFDYEAMMASVGYALDEVRAVQRAAHVGGTPLFELKKTLRKA